MIDPYKDIDSLCQWLKSNSSGDYRACSYAAEKIQSLEVERNEFKSQLEFVLAKGALVPQGLGGHARTIIESFVSRSAPSHSQQSAELVAEIKAQAIEEAVKLYAHKWSEEFAEVSCDIMRKGMGFIYPEGLLEYAKELRCPSHESEQSNQQTEGE